MNNETNLTVTIQLDLEAGEIFERCIKQVMFDRDEPRNEVTALALILGLAQLEILALQAKALEPLVIAAIRKLKSGAAVSNEELEVISHAARTGHLEARIVVEDFKRFGRSMDRS
jgi:hypothetical protein